MYILRIVSRELWHKALNLCGKTTCNVMELEPSQAGAKNPRAELSRVNPCVSLLNPALPQCSRSSHWDLRTNLSQFYDENLEPQVIVTMALY